MDDEARMVRRDHLRRCGAGAHSDANSPRLDQSGSLRGAPAILTAMKELPAFHGQLASMKADIERAAWSVLLQAFDAESTLNDLAGGTEDGRLLDIDPLDVAGHRGLCTLWALALGAREWRLAADQYGEWMDYIQPLLEKNQGERYVEILRSFGHCLDEYAESGARGIRVEQVVTSGVTPRELVKATFAAITACDRATMN